MHGYEVGMYCPCGGHQGDVVEVYVGCEMVEND